MVTYSATARMEREGEIADEERCDLWVVDVHRDDQLLGQARVYATRTRPNSEDAGVWPAATSHEWLSDALYAAVLDSVRDDEDADMLTMGRILDLAQEVIPLQKTDDVLVDGTRHRCTTVSKR